MAIKLNLLPPEHTINKDLAIILKTAKALGVISLAVFLVFGLGMAGLFIYYSINLKNITLQTDTLKSQISAQETSEQQLVLVKDRLDKIIVIQGKPSSLTNLQIVDPFLSNLPPDSQASELDLDPAKIGFTVGFGSNASLTSFFNNLKSATTFKSVVISAFSFNPATGYLASIIMTGK